MGFQIFVIIVSICMLIISGLALAGAGAKDDIFKSLCENKGGDNIQVAGETYKSIAEFEKKQYGGFIDYYMCTPVCPCNIGGKAKYDKKVGTSGFEFYPGKKRVMSM